MNNTYEKREWLEKLRENKGFTHQDIANKANISRQFYGMIENGERNPSVSVAKKISSVLDFNWTSFFEDSATKNCKSRKQPNWEGGDQVWVHFIAVLHSFFQNKRL
ncbi:putative transcriptional regulator [Schinkia azotoformans MEV2011]|uniref:Putative transcriptional regulator n=1 Tax=Schinkia azotoformans MEV2011 TaxID=1348973 RepID=A0A072NTA9_SCHAZ|nr:helix-turn-helix transcriptional regulator [Schinkia azotoformans]KEF40467.1 putative transcriptional regulator [Schinkia azotoformans MEV2011]